MGLCTLRVPNRVSDCRGRGGRRGARCRRFRAERGMERQRNPEKRDGFERAKHQGLCLPAEVRRGWGSTAKNRHSRILMHTEMLCTDFSSSVIIIVYVIFYNKVNYYIAALHFPLLYSF